MSSENTSIIPPSDSATSQSSPESSSTQVAKIVTPPSTPPFEVWRNFVVSIHEAFQGAPDVAEHHLKALEAYKGMMESKYSSDPKMQRRIVLSVLERLSESDAFMSRNTISLVTDIDIPGKEASSNSHHSHNSQHKSNNEKEATFVPLVPLGVLWAASTIELRGQIKKHLVKFLMCASAPQSMQQAGENLEILKTNGQILSKRIVAFLHKIIERLQTPDGIQMVEEMSVGFEDSMGSVSYSIKNCNFIELAAWGSRFCTRNDLWKLMSEYGVPSAAISAFKSMSDSDDNDNFTRLFAANQQQQQQHIRMGPRRIIRKK